MPQPHTTLPRLATGLALAGALALASCEKDACEQTWTQRMSVPITLDRAVVHDSIGAEAPLPLCVGGGIYAYERYLFVNRRGEGYHVLDNADPANPVNASFLRVPGATQMAFVDGRLVSDSYADLVVLEFGGPDDVRLASWTPNFLVTDHSIPLHGGLVVLDYEAREVRFEEDCSGAVRGSYPGCGGSAFVDCARVDFAADANFSAERTGGLSGGAVNVAGSLSRFAFAGEHLYVIDDAQVASYVVEADTLRPTSREYVGWGLETAVAREGFLYLGAQTGMHILALDDPEAPRHVSTYDHFTACDPVAVEGDVALVTLRSGRDCGRAAENVLVALDISDRAAPVRRAQVRLTNPTGVALHEGTAYVCDGPAGLRTFDVAGGLLADLGERERQVVEGREMRDVAILPYTGHLSVLTTGPDHVTQLTPTARGELVEVSSLGAETCTPR